MKRFCLMLFMSASAWGADTTAPPDAAPTPAATPVATPRLRLDLQAAVEAAATVRPTLQLGEAPRGGTLGRAFVAGLRVGVPLNEEGNARLGLDTDDGRLTLEVSWKW